MRITDDEIAVFQLEILTRNMELEMEKNKEKSVELAKKAKATAKAGN